MKTHISLIAVFAASTALAQDIVVLPEISLSANFDEVEVNETGATVSVITKDEIEKSTKTTLAEFLDTVPGVSFTRTGPLGGDASVRIRGAAQYENKVFIDGIDVSDPSLTQSYFNFGNMLMSNIDRIEVLRGAQSSVYGGSASGGVINIMTKRPEKGFSGSSALEYGSYNTFLSALSLGYGFEKGFINFTSHGLSTDGFSAADEANGNTEADGSESDRTTIMGEYEVMPGLVLGMTVFGDNSKNEYDDGFGAVADANNVSNNNSAGARLYLNYESGAFSAKLSSQAYTTEREYETAYGVGGFKAERASGELVLGYKMNDAVAFHAGVSSTDEAAEPTGTYGSGENKATISSYFAGVDLTPLAGLNLSLNARQDDHEKFGQLETYRVAAAYQANDQWALKASWSSGYRAPSFSESYPPYGNGALTYEQTKGYDAGLVYTPTSAYEFGATYFSYEIEDRITYDNATYAYYNEAETSTRSGVEIYGKMEVASGVSVNASYTNLDTQDADGKQFKRSATDEFSIGADVEYNAFSMNAELNHASGRIDKDGLDMDDYTVVDTQLGYQIGNGDVYLRVENLFDEEYQLAKGYGTSDRAFYVGYRFDF